MARSTIVFWGSFLLLIAGSADAQSSLGNTDREQMVLTSSVTMPLSFTENKGQFGEKTLFKANADGAVFYFCRDEVACLLIRDTGVPVEEDAGLLPDMPEVSEEFDKPRYEKARLLIKAQFIDASPCTEVIGVTQLPHNDNYFLGNEPDKWRTDVRNYSAITYRDVYAGIDLTYYGDGGSMKYDFTVKPGADISQIRIHYEGVDNLSVEPSGDLRIHTSFGSFFEKRPYVYQDINGVKKEIPSRFRLIAADTFQFCIEDDMDQSHAIIVDPELQFSSYLGGSAEDMGYGIAIDDYGCVYVTGNTESPDFPTVDPYDDSYNGGDYNIGDIFVAKFAESGQTLQYCTYIGGSSGENGDRIVVDNDGCAYITGDTWSYDFPTQNPYDGSFNSGGDVFVLKLSSSGNSLIYSTYLGGPDLEYSKDIDIDDQGNAYITGNTYSTYFPMVNPYDGTHNGYDDVFVAKLSAGGNSLLYSTFLGSTGSTSTDLGKGIAVDDDGNAYVTGITGGAGFPTVNAYDESFNGGYRDCFIAKLSPSIGGPGSLLYSTYLGGSGTDRAYDLDIDTDGNAYVTGDTASDDFPVVNPYDESYDGGIDIFVSKLAASGSSLIYSTYVGGHDLDRGYAISVSQAGSAFITGETKSADFPTVLALDDGYNGFYDVFLTQLSTAGNSLAFSTYMGGPDPDSGNDVIADNNGHVYLTGDTRSANFPVLNPYDGTPNGGYDVFVAKFSAATSVVEDRPIIPQEFSLYQNYPNPFNPTTLIEYSIPISGIVSLEVLDITGRRTQTLVHGFQKQGNCSITYTAGDLPTGVYLYRIQVGDYTKTKRMILIR